VTIDAATMLTQDLIARLSEAPTLSEVPKVVDVGVSAPANPPQELQQIVVGRAYEEAYAEAVSFVRVADQWSAKHRGAPLSKASLVLDFGSGWGRISRTLLTLVKSDRIIAADVDQNMTALVGSTLPGINSITVGSLPPTFLGDAVVDVTTAFSVFSHLSPAAHTAWAKEFGRITADGGLAVVTVLDRAFFAQLAGAKAAMAAGETNGVTESLAGLFDDLDAATASFDAGDIVYAGNGGGGTLDGDFYGWAAAPQQFMESTWNAAGFDIVEWVPANVLFPQAVVGLRRRKRERPGLAQLAASRRSLRKRLAANETARAIYGRIRRAR
jgi:hypothetical protein